MVAPILASKYSGYVNTTTPQSLTEQPKSKNKMSNTSKIAMVGLVGLGIAGATYVAITQKKPINKELNDFATFIKKAEYFGFNNTHKLRAQCIEENIIGTGQNSIVYRFSMPEMKNWAIKISRHPDEVKYGITAPVDYSFGKPIVEIPDSFNGLNMGNPIAQIGERITILKRIHAKPHSIKDWSAHARAGKEITQAETIEFLEDVKKIAQFPQQSFDDYALKLKAIEQKGYKADSFNPNNVMINYETKEISIIDYYEYKIDAYRNTKYDLICPLVDYSNFSRFYEKMNPQQQKELVSTTGIIAKKCTKAAQKHNISTSEVKFKDHLSRIDYRDGLNKHYSNNFELLKNLCGNVIL